MRAQLFATCLTDRFFAAAAADAVRLLRSLEVDVDVPLEQSCCGQPASNAGEAASAERMAEHTRSVFRGPHPVIVLSGSCAARLRGGAFSDLAGRAFTLAGFIVDVLGVTRLGDGLQGRSFAYHHGCHALRELGEREQPETLLRESGASLAAWTMDRECCGFGGLFSVKTPEVSVAMADRKLATLPRVEALVSSDGGCLLHLGGRARRLKSGPPVRLLSSVLWEARRGAA